MPYVHGLRWVVIVAAGKEPGASTREIVGQVQEYRVRGGHPLFDAFIIRRQDVVGVLCRLIQLIWRCQNTYCLNNKWTFELQRSLE